MSYDICLWLIHGWKSVKFLGLIFYRHVYCDNVGKFLNILMFVMKILVREKLSTF